MEFNSGFKGLNKSSIQLKFLPHASLQVMILSVTPS